MEQKYKLQLYIQSQNADAAPPLGTILGNLGVNTVNFCKDFNAFTKDLPPHYTLSVQIKIFANRSYKFSVQEPPLSSIINLLTFERDAYKKSKQIKQACISLKTIIQLSLWKFPNVNLAESIPIILGVIKSFNLTVTK